MENVLVSICCLAYNHELYIKDALDSFLNQKTSFKYEIIVHDDFSTDGTRDIISDYYQRYPDIIVPFFEEENQYSKKIKILPLFMKKAKGKYLAFCEGDDFWSDFQKLEKQIEVLEKEVSLSACVHNTTIWNLKLDKKEKLNVVEKQSTLMDVKRILEWENRFCFHLSSVVMRKKVFDTIPEFYLAPQGFEDYPLGLLLALSGPIWFINEEMSVYRKFTVGSWSEKNKDNSSYIFHKQQLILMYKLFDTFTEAKYHKAIEKCIKEQNYRIMDLECDKKHIIGFDTLKWKIWRGKRKIYNFIRYHFR